MENILRIYLEKYDYLYMFVMEKIRSPADSADIVEEAFLQTIEQKKLLNSCNEEEMFGKILTLCEKKCNEYNSAVYRKLPYDEKYGAKVIKSMAERIELKIDFQKWLSRLSDEEREVIKLYYFENMDSKSIAALLSLSQDCVLQKMSRARQKLKHIIK